MTFAKCTTKRTCAVALLVALLSALTQPAVAAETWNAEREKRIGEEAAKAILAETPEWSNEEQAARCQKIVDKIVPHTQRPDVAYQVRLLDSDDANAFSLPGGIIFITRGLLVPSGDPDSAYLVVQSEAELAGIIAHEIAHNCHYHALRQAERGDKLLRGGLIASLLTLLIGGGTAGAFQVLGFGLSFSRGILNHYSIGYETEADQAAISYLVKAGYNPAGLLTFMERLAAEQRARPSVDLGIYQTHPYPVERVQAIRRAIRSQGLEINRRAVTNWRKAEAIEAIVHGEPGAILLLWDRTIYTFRVPAADGKTPPERAQAAASVLNNALAEGMSALDIRVESSDTSPAITVMGQRLLTVMSGDLDDPGESLEVGVQKVVRELRAALFGDTLDRHIKRPSE